MVNLRVDDKTVVITGLARGLGAAIAQAVLESGGDVFGIDVLPDLVKEDWIDRSALETKSGCKVTLFQADVRHEADIESALKQAAKQATDRHKPICGLVNCAGVQYTSDAEAFAVQEFQRVIDINVMGSFIVAKHTALVMIAEKWTGSMVLIGSIAGYVANRGIHGSAYCASKAAVQMMTKSFAYEWGKYGIRVNSLSPGPIETKMVGKLLDDNVEIKGLFMAGTVLGRLGSVDDVCGITLLMLSEKSGYMTGADVRLDGGATVSV